MSLMPTGQFPCDGFHLTRKQLAVAYPCCSTESAVKSYCCHSYRLIPKTRIDLISSGSWAATTSRQQHLTGYTKIYPMAFITWFDIRGRVRYTGSLQSSSKSPRFFFNVAASSLNLPVGHRSFPSLHEMSIWSSAKYVRSRSRARRQF